jgi:hypothetical protein
VRRCVGMLGALSSCGRYYLRKRCVSQRQPSHRKALSVSKHQGTYKKEHTLLFETLVPGSAGAKSRRHPCGLANCRNLVHAVAIHHSNHIGQFQRAVYEKIYNALIRYHWILYAVLITTRALFGPLLLLIYGTIELPSNSGLT